MRTDPIDLASPDYTPVRLINETAALLRAKSDFHLARILEMDCGQLSRIRNRKAPVSDRFMIDIADRTGWHIEHIRQLAGIPFDGPRALAVITQVAGRRFPRRLVKAAA